MAWLFVVVFSSFYNVSDIWSEFTDGGVIAKLIRHHLLSDWNVRWRERPLGLVDSLHLRFLHTAESVRVSPPVIIIMWLLFKNKQKKRPDRPKKKKRHKTETQSEFTTKIFIKKNVFLDVKEEHLGPCARRHRWHVLSQLTRRWKKPTPCFDRQWHCRPTRAKPRALSEAMPRRRSVIGQQPLKKRFN